MDPSHEFAFYISQNFPFPPMSKRFKLVFLGENEEYLTDIGCTMDTRMLNSSGVETEENCHTSLLKLLRSGGSRGRLRIGSYALYLDLDNVVCYDPVSVGHTRSRTTS